MIDDVAAQLVESARSLRPRLVAEQAETERRSYYSAELHQVFADAGLYRAHVPKRYGGHQLGLDAFTRLLVELGRGCASTAWCFGLAASHALLVASYFGERAQDEVFAGEFRAASVAAPVVRATRDGAGWRLDGTVGYCSGAPYSTHFLGQALIADLPPDEALSRMLLFIAPRGTWTMLDDWRGTTGLRGSGSQSIRFDNARLPDHLVLEGVNLGDVDVDGGTPGLRQHGASVYCGRALPPLTATLAAIAVGAGYGALDDFADRLDHPGPLGTPRREDVDYQRWYGAAAIRLATAEAALLRCADEHAELCAGAASGVRPYRPLDEQRLSAIAREVIVQVRQTVEECLVPAAGASTLREGTRFERAHRDLSMMAVHRGIAIRDLVHRQYALLSLAAEPPFSRSPRSLPHPPAA